MRCIPADILPRGKRSSGKARAIVTTGQPETPPPSLGAVVDAAKAKSGLGWYGMQHGGGPPGVYELLEMGSPRMALARAIGCPFAPWLINVVATSETADQTLVADVGFDTKLTQDAYVDQLVFRVQPQVTAVNQFDTLSQFFLNYQSGIKAKLDIVGAPRYAVAPKFTPISTLSDMVGGGRWPHGWILTYNQNIEMSFQTSFPLPATPEFVPVEVTATFRLWEPIGEAFTKMDAETAIRRLAQECGIECSAAYNKFVCR